MRFGVLLFGYLWLFVCKGFELYPDFLPDIIPNIIGYAIILYSLIKLEEFNKFFRGARNILHLLILFVLFSDIYKIYDFSANIEENNLGTIMLIIVKILTFVIFTAFHNQLFKGIAELAGDVNIPSIKKSAKLNYRILLIVTLLFIVSRFDMFGTADQYIIMIYTLLHIIWLIMTIVMVFRCYMWICLEGDENMPKK